MILPDGVKVTRGGQTFIGEIPDALVDDGIKKAVVSGGEQVAAGKAKTEAADLASRKARAVRKAAEKEAAKKAKAEAKKAEAAVETDEPESGDRKKPKG